jgi:hypothetical protein
MEASAEASARAMGSDDVRETLSDARSVFGDSAFEQLAESGAAGNASRAPKRAAQPRESVARMSLGGRAGAPLDLTGIRTEADLDAAARAMLPAGEAAKLAWTGLMGGGDAAAAAGGGGGAAADAAALLADSTLSVRVAPAPALGSTRGGALDWGSGTAQAFALWSAAAARAADGDGDGDGGGSGGSGGAPPALFATEADSSALALLRAVMGGGGGGAARADGATTVELPADPSALRLRFDLSGSAVAGGAASDAAAAAGLAHHGGAPGAAGYTLVDLLGLTRSTVEGQRLLALRALAQLLRRR